MEKIGDSLSVTFTQKCNSLSLNRIANLVIVNNKDRPVSIFSINAIFDKEICLILHRCEPPLIVKPYETISIETEEYSGLSINGHPYEPDLSSAEIYVETSHKLIKCRTREKPKLLDDYRKVLKHIKKFNGIVFSENFKYLVVYKQNEELKTTFIHYSGYFENDWSGFAFNMISPSNTLEITAEDILNTFLKYKFSEQVETYALYEIEQAGFKLIERK